MNVAKTASEILKDRYVKGDPAREAAVQAEREAAAKPDMVNHPPHYTFGGVEVIVAIEAWELNYRRGNVVKYLVRAGRKSKQTELEDLKKAQFYLNREIAKMEEEERMVDALVAHAKQRLAEERAAKEPDGDHWQPVHSDAAKGVMAFKYVPKKNRKGKKK